jgi:uncharacterized protein
LSGSSPRTHAEPSKSKERAIRVLKAIALTIALLYLLVCALAFVAQRRILFPGPRLGRLPPGEAGRIIAVDGGTPMLFQEPGPGKPVVVYFHGNGEQIADVAWLSGHLARVNVGFAAIEYPGYGLAMDRGEPSEAAILDAAERGILHLVEREGIARDKLVIAGQSLGTGLAMAMAARGLGARVFLLCPFTSIPDVGAALLPFLPVRLLVRDPFDSAARAKDVQVPVLVVHGSFDELIPVELGRSLAARLPQGRYVEIAGGRHNDLWSYPEVTQEVLAFVREWSPKAVEAPQ